VGGSSDNCNTSLSLEIKTSWLFSVFILTPFFGVFRHYQYCFREPPTGPPRSPKGTRITGWKLLFQRIWWSPSGGYEQTCLWDIMPFILLVCCFVVTRRFRKHFASMFRVENSEALNNAKLRRTFLPSCLAHIRPWIWRRYAVPKRLFSFN
jgi:hypothetical protein